MNEMKLDINNFFMIEALDSDFEKQIWLSINSSYVIDTHSFVLNGNKEHLNCLNKMLNKKTIDDEMC